MLLQLIDQKIRRAFSNAAQQYDVLASLHKEIGRELLEKIKDFKNPLKILDVGMGTGYLTNKLVHYFPEAEVFGLDFAPGMVEQAKKNSEGFTVVEADASSLPFPGNTFDLIISNLMYQWISDLPQAFASAHSVLKPKGLFYLTMFGRDTFQELFESLKETSEIPRYARKGSSPTFPLSIRRLAAQSEVQRAFSETGFKDIEFNSEQIKVHFPSMKDLLKWIKDIGANYLEKDIFIGKEWLSRADDYYSKNFGDKFGIYATFQVIWAEARK